MAKILPPVRMKLHYSWTNPKTCSLVKRRSCFPQCNEVVMPHCEHLTTWNPTQFAKMTIVMDSPAYTLCMLKYLCIHCVFKTPCLVLFMQNCCKNYWKKNWSGYMMGFFGRRVCQKRSFLDLLWTILEWVYKRR